MRHLRRGRWIIALLALGFAVYQFVHAAQLGYRNVGPGRAYHASYVPDYTRFAQDRWDVRLRIPSQNRTVTIAYAHPREPLWMLVARQGSVAVDTVEVDRMTNEVSRVRLGARWLTAAGRQSEQSLLIAGGIGLAVAALCAGTALRDRRRDGGGGPVGARRGPVRRA
jgi:hypothetical protein